MSFSYKEILLTTFLIFSIFLASPQLGAIRSFREGWVKKEGVLFESLRERDPPSGRNPCTYIPRGGPGKCTLNRMNLAGDVVRTSLVFPAVPIYCGCFHG
ncbi:hypothetical protein CJ030_MR6G007063 [Morella rubra]|uniref:Uncharacterized protein n=1 Tax=Morella rubra TaxID=262757 RepID=A0A6A1V7R7_9ROSI|nr:hypothetical protein CJ030_MR6G007063 [Morella rubra]